MKGKVIEFIFVMVDILGFLFILPLWIVVAGVLVATQTLGISISSSLIRIMEICMEFNFTISIVLGVYWMIHGLGDKDLTRKAAIVILFTSIPALIMMRLL